MNLQNVTASKFTVEIVVNGESHFAAFEKDSSVIAQMARAMSRDPNVSRVILWRGERATGIFAGRWNGTPKNISTYERGYMLHDRMF